MWTERQIRTGRSIFKRPAVVPRRLSSRKAKSADSSGMEHGSPGRILPNRIFCILALFLSAARFTASGFVYYPQLDDYIQYYKYTKLFSPSQAVINYGMLAARPLSNAADVFIWTKFWGCLFTAVIIISLIYGLSLLMLRVVFARLFPVLFTGSRGSAFVLFCLLLPLNIEGTYWISASTRVVCGLFWTSLSAVLFIRWLDGAGLHFAALYAVSQLCAMASYEQTLVLTAALTLLIAFVFYKKSRPRALAALLTLSNALLYWIFISRFRGSSALYASAYGAVSPFSAYFWTDHLPHVLKQFAAAFAGGGALTLFRGAARGGALITVEGRTAFGLLTLFCGGFVFAYMLIIKGARRLEQPAQKTAGALPLASPLASGAILALAPLAPHVLKANPWFSLRGTAASLPGIALCISAVISFIAPAVRVFIGQKPAKYISAGLCAVFTVICFSATASELDDYKKTYINDRLVMEAVGSAVNLESITGKIALVNVEASYLSRQNFYYHEHIHGVTESDWALSGALFAYSGGTLDPAARFVPFPSEKAPALFKGEYAGFDEVFIYANGKFVRADIN